MDVGLPFSSSLTLREVMELLFAVGARRWRLVKSLVAVYQVRINGGIRQVGGVTFWRGGGGAVVARSPAAGSTRSTRSTRSGQAGCVTRMCSRASRSPVES